VDAAVLTGVVRRGIDEGIIRADTDTDIELVLDTLVGLITHRGLWGVTR
jgi:hypothetical protein